MERSSGRTEDGRSQEDHLPNILIISTHFPPSSNTSGRRPYFLARYLRDKGHHVEVLTSAEPERNPWTVNTDGIRVHRYPNTSVQRDLSYGQRLLARCIRSLKDTFIGGPLRLIGDLFLPVNYGIRWDLNTEELMTSLRRPDVIIATVPHWDTMDHAMRLANIWKCQFLVDHRDP